ncbi:unnamed protein product [Caenorhabditis auriculariae]|uniref:HTH psq-type domain-containing protein n=1 Tax=Caenorhabditis auriculariae TaxID=2777116 RepID=A0A8S1GV63_9PELO|nr:unnamed protein product [Caenorhabditis auriculariae]
MPYKFAQRDPLTGEIIKTRKAYSATNLLNAMRDVVTGRLSVTEASVAHKVPRSTVFRRLKKARDEQLRSMGIAEETPSTSKPRPIVVVQPWMKLPIKLDNPPPGKEWEKNDSAVDACHPEEEVWQDSDENTANAPPTQILLIPNATVSPVQFSVNRS